MPVWKYRLLEDECRQAMAFARRLHPTEVNEETV